ncbi:MAG: PAS domain S-box protein, partial [Bacteroidales bacterium]|nr:PAS domain S-box protein [Bacteroidales bacterium]
MSEVYKNLFQLSTQVKLLGKYETKNNKCNFTLIDTSISLKKHFKIEAVSIENTTFNQLLKNEKLKKLHELLLKIEGLIAERKPLLRIQLEFEQEKWHYMLIDYLPDNFFVCSLYDITREYRYLEEFENFFKLIPDLFCVLDDKAVFVKVNPMWEKIMGYKEKDLVGKTFFELTHPDEYEETYVNWESFKNQTALNSFTIRYKSKDKQYRYLDWKIYRYQNKYYAGARDVTRTVEKNTRLEKLAEFSNDLFLTVGSRPDIKTIIENLLWLSNSKFCFVNIYNQQSGSYITRYVVG